MHFTSTKIGKGRALWGATRDEEQAFQYCKHLFSVEIPEHAILILYEAFESCNNPRNLALSHKTVLRGNIFWDIAPRPTPSLWCVAIGGDLGPFLIALRIRFKLCYY